MKFVRNYEIRIIPSEEGDYFAVRFPDFPGIITGGDTIEDALRNAEEALELTLSVMKERKVQPPKPKSSFSGQFNVRVPKDLHRRLIAGAEEEGVSLNAYINYLLVGELKAGRPASGKPAKPSKSQKEKKLKTA